MKVAALVATSYLLECMEKLPISMRVLNKLSFNDLLELEQQILAALDEGARKLSFDESPTLSIWLAGLKTFELETFETNGLNTTPKAIFSKEESGAIKSLFQEVFQSLFASLGQRVDLLKLLFGAIDQWQRAYNEQMATGVRLGLDIRITVPEPNPFAKENDRRYLLLSELLWALEQNIIPKIQWQKLSAAQQFGGFLFFAITQSGITQINKLNQLASLALIRKKMDEPFSGFLLFANQKKFGLTPNTPYQAQILEGKSKKEFQSIYRWIPDPITKRIYERYRRNWDGLQTDPKQSDVYINDFLHTLLEKIPDSPKPKKNLQRKQLEKIIGELSHLSTLFKASRAYQRRTLPSFIWHYLENTYQTKDLDPNSIERLHEFEYERAASKNSQSLLHTKLLKRTVKSLALKDLDHIGPGNEPEEDVRSHPPIDWCADLVAILNKDYSAEEKILAIRQLRSTLALEDCSLIDLLSSWMIDELARNIDQDILRDYASLFLPAVIAQYDLEEDFSDFDETEREEEIEELIAENALENSEESAQDYSALFRAAWHKLNLYLLNSNKITAEQYPPKKPNGRKVDAQYISEREYRAIQTYLWTKEIPTRLKNQCLLILTLAYRFGLRRSEVIKLAVSHVSFSENAPDQLLLRWWSQRRLKSPSAKRTLPIEGVLTEQEYGWLHLMTLTRRMGSWLDMDLFSMGTLTLQQHISTAKAHYQLIKIQGNLSNEQEPPKDKYLFIDEDKSVDSRVLEIVDLLHEAMRTTIANPKLRLHHLRHSCAMNTLMLLLSPKLKQSKPLLLSMYYGNEREITQLIGSLHPSAQLLFNQYIFNGELFESRSHLMRMALLNDQHHSSSEVYTTSRLLGHSSPRTTFASYIHVLSLLTSAFLYERYEVYSKDLQLALYPNHPRTLNRYQKAVAKGKHQSLLHQQKLGRPFK